MPTFLERIKARRFSAASSSAVSIGVNGESESRLDVDAGGKLLWGSGSATGDTNLYRSAADTLKTDDAFTANSLGVTSQFTLPTTDGSANQVMVTNGSGTITWANQTGGSGSPGGSDGQVQYNNGGLFGGASALYYDDVNSRVGIGTTTPNRTLDVVQASSGATPYNLTGGIDIESSNITGLNVMSPNTGYGRIYFGAPVSATAGAVEYIHNATVTDGYMKFRAGNADRMHILGNGRVGIGTTSPSVPLHLNIGTDNNGVIIESTDATARMSFKDSSTSGNTHVGVGAVGNDLALWANNARRLTIQGGNVGIGDTTPSYTLDVNGTGRFTGNVAINGILTTDSIVNDNGNFLTLEAGDNWNLAGNASGEYVWMAAEGGLVIVSSDSNTTAWADREQIRITAEGGIDNRLRVHGYLRTNVSGSYGSIQTANVNSWDGFSINGRVVFMHNDSNNWGIYNDVNNEWMIYGTLNAGVELKYNNTTRLWTDNEGSRTTGRHYTDGSNYAYSYYGHSNIAGTGNAIHTPNGIYSTGTNWLYGTVLTNGNTVGSSSQQIGDVHAAGWLRTYGQRGWYSQSYGGGWYMIDTAWLRTYNNKSIYSGSGQIRSDAGNGFNGPNLTTTYSYNTLRWNSGNGDFMPYASLTEMKTDITDIGGLLSYLNERSLIYDLRPKIFTEADDRVDAEGNPVYTTRGEYAHGMLAEDVLEVAPELAYFDHNGNLISYGNDALIPDIIAELQRLMPMIEELYGDKHSDWVPPSPRPASRAAAERDRYNNAAATQAAAGLEDISDPVPNRAEEDPVEVS